MGGAMEREGPVAVLSTPMQSSLQVFPPTSFSSLQVFPLFLSPGSNHPPLFSLCKLSLPGVDQLPENVDPGKREEFLTDAEFVEVSGVGVFYGIPFYWN